MSKRRSDPPKKLKLNNTPHSSPRSNYSLTCPALLRKNHAPSGTLTCQRASRQDPENEPTNSQDVPKAKHKSDLALTNRFATLQEPTMSGQDVTGVGKRKAPTLQTDAFKKKSALASTSRQNVEGYWLKISKITTVSLNAARSTTTTKPVNRTQANNLVEQLRKYFRDRPKGIPQGLNLATIHAVRINNTAHVVRMHFNPDDETRTTANENANRYVAGEPTIDLRIGPDYVSVQCEPDDASHLSVTHIVPMCKVTDFQGRTISFHNATAAKSVSRKNLLEIASYLQEPQLGSDAAYGDQEFVRMDTDSDGKQTATVWFAPTSKDSATIAEAQADGDLEGVVNIYANAANRTAPIIDFDEILMGQGASVTQHDMGDAYDQAYEGKTVISLTSVITPMRLGKGQGCHFCWSVHLSQKDRVVIDVKDGEKLVAEGKWTNHRHPSCRNQYAYEMRCSLYQGWNDPLNDDDEPDEEQQTDIAAQTVLTIAAVEEARLAWKTRKETIDRQAAARSAATTAAGTRPLKPNSKGTNTSINIKPSSHTDTVTPPCEPYHQHPNTHRKIGAPHATLERPERDTEEREGPTREPDDQRHDHAESQVPPTFCGGKQIQLDKHKAHQSPRIPATVSPNT